MRSRDTILRLQRFRTDEKRRQVADLEKMVAEFMKKFDDLEGAVKAEEVRTGVSDPAHFSYSTTAKATSARRDNLLKSVGDLKDQLADAATELEEEEGELKKMEHLAEKETGFTNRLAQSAS